jgi:prepilin-type N-terminal cleavage/methylation domain-containing protein
VFSVNSVAKKMRKGFTITELLVAIGLLAAVLAVSSMIFSYSIDAQRTAAATTEIMRTLRAITDQLNIDFQGLQTDGYLVLWSGTIGSNPNSRDALYFFSTGDFQSWFDSDRRSNIARIYFGPSRNSPSDLALDALLLTPGYFGLDYNDANFAECQIDVNDCLGEDPNTVLSVGRPTTNITSDPDNARRLLAQNVGSLLIEWTEDNPSGQIKWFGRNNPFGAGAAFENPGNPYIARWTPSNQSLWPKALKFTFMLYDSKDIIKNGRRFEHIVYIGK